MIKIFTNDKGVKYLFVVLSLLLVSCEGKDYIGYVVHKEYIEGHMCHEDEKSYENVQLSGIGVVIVPKTTVVPPHRHSYQESVFNIYVANKTGVKCFNVDSVSWYKYHLGKKYRFYNR